MPVLHQGFYGVQVFFAVSGFLITALLLREMDKYGTISLRDFYIRRALRIWPLYYAVLAIYVLNALVFERGTVRAASFIHYRRALQRSHIPGSFRHIGPGECSTWHGRTRPRNSSTFFGRWRCGFCAGFGPRCF